MESAKSKERAKYKLIREKWLPEVEECILNEVFNYIRKNFIKKGQKNYVGIYWPLQGEPNILKVKDNLNLKIALPACLKDRGLSYHPWKGKPLRNDACGIPSPMNEMALNPSEIDLLLIPGLSIDKTGHRLGYGGGFYDRLRGNPKWRSIPALVVLPKSCISKEPLPRDHWDVPYTGWINEDGYKELFPTGKLNH